MKKLAIIFILVMFGYSAYNQDVPKFVYCEVVSYQKLLSTKVTIQVDFGQNTKAFADNRMKDPNTGKPFLFNSVVDALNFMGKQGWEFVQVYTVMVSETQYFHYMMKKPFSELSQEEQQVILKPE